MFSRIPIQSIDTTVGHNIDVTVCKDICRMFSIPDNTPMLFNEDENIFKKKGGVNGVRANNTVPHSFIRIESEETPEDGWNTALVDEWALRRPIYYDKEIGTGIYLRTQNVIRTIKFTYVSNSKSEMMSLINRMRVSDIYERATKQHDLSVFINIPNQALECIKHFYTLKSKRWREDEKITLAEYLKKHTEFKFDAINLGKGNEHKPDLTYSIFMANVMGVCNTDLYTLTFNKDKARYSIEVEYAIYYETPSFLIMSYPLQIWNTPVHPSLTNCHFRSSKRGTLNGVRSRLNWHGLYDLNLRDTLAQLNSEYRHTLRYPYNDIMINTELNPRYSTIITVQLTVDENDPYAVCNIFSLPTLKFKDSFISYIKSNHKDMFTFGKSMFYLQLLRDDEVAFRLEPYMENNGDIFTTYPMSLRHTYRLRISILDDIHSLSDEAFEALNNWLDTVVEEEAYVLVEDIGIEVNKDSFDNIYTVDEYGNILDPDGYVVYSDGERVIDPDTNTYVLGARRLGVYNGDIETGMYIDTENRLVNADGYIVDEDGNLIKDDIGLPIEGGTPTYTPIEDYSTVLEKPTKKYKKVQHTEIKNTYLSDFIHLYKVQLPGLSTWVDVKPSDIISGILRYRDAKHLRGLDTASLFKRKG